MTDREIKHEIVYIFKQNLHKRLKRTIKGSVKVHVHDETLIVTVFGVNGIVFKYTCDKFFDTIDTRCFSEYHEQIILKKYRAYVRNLFFM